MLGYGNQTMVPVLITMNIEIAIVIGTPGTQEGSGSLQVTDEEPRQPTKRSKVTRKAPAKKRVNRRANVLTLIPQ